MLERLREQVKKSGYQEPFVVIEQDEVLRAINHEIMSRVFLGWAIIQGLAGSLIGMLLDDQLLLGFTLMAFSAVAIAVWQIWITKRGLVLAAKEGTLLSQAARRMAIKVAIFQGVFFGYIMWFINGRLSRRKHEA